MRYSVSVAVLVAIAGCASQPAPVTPAPVASAPATAAPVAEAVPKDPNQHITLGEARRLGYTIVNEKGKTVYCRDQTETGSHARKETICLTEDELIAAREASKRNLDQMQRITPPPACGPLTGIGC